MCDWNDRRIANWAEWNVRPFNRAHVNAGGLDLCFGGGYRLPRKPDADNPARWGELIDADEFTIQPARFTMKRVKVELADESYWDEVYTPLPGSFLLIATLEYVTMPKDVQGVVKMKSSPSRDGLNFVNAGIIDPGFYGPITLAMINHHPEPLVIKRGERIVQLVLSSMVETPLAPYRGKYNGQGPAQPAR